MRRPLLVVPTIGLLLLAAACGSTGPTASEEEASASADGGSAAGPVSVTDARGETVELDAPAADVVALEWGLVENLVALGVQPVGVADVEGYGVWDDSAPLEDGVADVGVRGEPSIDAIIGLDADLVVATSGLPETAVSQVEDAGIPVVVLEGSDAADPIGYMRTTVETLAELTGTTEQGAELWADFEAAVADGAERITAADAEGTEFTMADGWDASGTITIRMYTSGAMLTAVAEELGLVNAWEGEGDPAYGLEQTDVEGLTQLDGDSAFLYVHTDTAADPFRDGLADNPVWTSLPFVESDNVHRLPDRIWMFGGPLSAQRFIDATVDAVTD
jgi:ferric hydroxamate transport system substrate-binding protein